MKPERLTGEVYAPPAADGADGPEAASHAGRRSAAISLGCVFGATIAGAGTIAAIRATGSLPVGVTGFAVATLVALVGVGHGVASLGQAGRVVGRGFPIPAFLLVICSGVLTLLGALMTYTVLVVPPE